MDTLFNLVPLIVFLPVLGLLVNMAFGGRMSEKAIGAVASAASGLAFVAFARYYDVFTGQLFVFFVMTVAAAEVAVGLALIVTIFRSKQSIDVDQMNSLKG